MVVGNATNPITNNVVFNFIGTRNGQGIVINSLTDVGTKVLAVTGNFSAFGVPPNITATRLIKKAYVGDKYIIV